MKIVVDREPFARAVAAASRAAEKSDNIPILKHLLLKPTGQQIGLVGTNTALQSETFAPADITGSNGVSGDIAVLATPLAGLADRLPDGAQIVLEWNEAAQDVTVKAGRSRYNLHALPAKDFYQFPEMTDAATFMLPCADLLRATKAVEFAICDEVTRQYLGGIYLHVDDDSHIALGGGRQKLLVLCATDGSNLARAHLALPEIKGALKPPIIPKAAITELNRLLADDDGDLEISFSETLGRFATRRAVLTTKLVDGTFPDYIRVIPPNNARQMIVDRPDLMRALERLRFVGNEMRMRCEISDDTLKLTLASSETGNAEEEIAIQWEGAPLSIGLSLRRTLEILSVMKCDQCIFKFSDAVSPVTINAWRAGVIDHSQNFVTMPVGLK